MGPPPLQQQCQKGVRISADRADLYAAVKHRHIDAVHGAPVCLRLDPVHRIRVSFRVELFEARIGVQPSIDLRRPQCAARAARLTLPVLANIRKKAVCARMERVCCFDAFRCGSGPSRDSTGDGDDGTVAVSSAAFKGGRHADRLPST